MLIQKQYNKLFLTGNLAPNPAANTTMFFIIEKTKETILDFSQGTVKVFENFKLKGCENFIFFNTISI